MGNRHSISTIEFVNKSDIGRVEVTMGTQKKTLNSKGVAVFEILEASPTVIKGFDPSGRTIHELKCTISHVNPSQLWKITNSGIKHKRSPFFTENHAWAQKISPVSK